MREDVQIGPFRFAFLPDADDPGTGLIVIETDSGYRSSTALGVPQIEWDRFKAIVGSAIRALS